MTKGLVDGATSLLDAEKYSDLTLTTQTRSFKVHKAIVCTLFKVLAAMCDSGFRESSSSALLLNRDNLAAVEPMITFLYTGNYDPGDSDVTEGDGRFSVGVELMASGSRLRHNRTMSTYITYGFPIDP